MAGQGARLHSAWAFEAEGVHLPRLALVYAETDVAERLIWAAWWFEAVIETDMLFAQAVL